MSSKRICLISLVNIYLTPYISKYTSILDCDYDVIYWNRHGVEEEKIIASNIYPFQYTMDEGVGKLSKLKGYFKFREFALKIIEKNNYDGVILLQTSAGMLIQTFLEKKYTNRYVVDIRDYTMEENPVFYFLEKKLIKNSALAVISSKGYEKFLPEFNYTVVHNDVAIEEMRLQEFENKKRKKEPIVISYIGLIRFQEQCKKVILKFKNDNRFVLRFIGTHANSLKDFCKKHEVQNVELIDRFPPELTLDFYNETNIIFNLYGNNSTLLNYALSNKLYYAAKLKMPILVCPNTFMEEISCHYGFGYSVNLNAKNLCNDLYNYYTGIDWEDFSSSCDDFIKVVKKDNNKFESDILNFIKVLN